MKTLYKAFIAGAVALGLSSCSDKTEFHTADYVTFANSTYTIKEDAAELKIPINLHSSKAVSTTVTYVVETVREDYAKPGVDYTIEGDGVLVISNEEGAVCDSIVIKPIPQVGTLQGNKTISLSIQGVTADGLNIGAFDSCTITIIDVDGGINLLAGSWTGTDIPTSKNPGSVSWQIALVSDGDEGLADYPTANLKILAGAAIVDAVGNDWTSQVDIYARFDDSDNTLHIFPQQVFAAGNFGEKLGVLYVAMDTATTLKGGSEDVVFAVEDGVLTLQTQTYFALYDSSLTFSNNTCGYYSVGAKIVKD